MSKVETDNKLPNIYVNRLPWTICTKMAKQFPLSKTFAYTGKRILNKSPKIYKHINKKIQLMEDT